MPNHFTVIGQSLRFGDYENLGSFASRAEADAHATKIAQQRLPLAQFGNVHVREETRS